MAPAAAVAGAASAVEHAAGAEAAAHPPTPAAAAGRRSRAPVAASQGGPRPRPRPREVGAAAAGARSRRRSDAASRRPSKATRGSIARAPRCVTPLPRTPRPASRQKRHLLAHTDLCAHWLSSDLATGAQGSRSRGAVAAACVRQKRGIGGQPLRAKRPQRQEAWQSRKRLIQASAP